MRIPPITKSTALAVAAVTIAGITYGAGYYQITRVQVERDSLQSECRATAIFSENQTEAPSYAFTTFQVSDNGRTMRVHAQSEPTEAQLEFIFKSAGEATTATIPDCTGVIPPPSDALPVQLMIRRAELRVRLIEETYYLYALWIALAGTIPFAWYFLLDRIKEVCNAVMGRP